MSTATFFQTSPYVVLTRGTVGTAAQFVPPVHAKRFGTGHTACGLATDTWVKAFATPFTPGAADTCRACATAAENA